MVLVLQKERILFIFTLICNKKMIFLINLLLNHDINAGFSVVFQAYCKHFL